MPGQHATLAPSAASRWLRCPGSVALAQQYEQEETSYAAEGTAAHALAERALREGQDAEAYIGQEFYGHTVDSTMAAYVQQYVEEVYSRLSPNAELRVEERVTVDSVPGVWGTVDALIIDHAAGELIVIDLKYGQGVPVSAVENEQLMLYALGAYEDASLIEDIDTIQLVIVQPRIYSEPSVWGCDASELMTFGERAASKASVAMHCVNGEASHPEHYLEPGDVQCRWCPAKADCPALRDEVYNEVFGEEDGDEASDDPRPVDRLDGEELGTALSRVERIEAWCKAVRDRAHEELAQGRDVPGFKLVEGRRGQRQWQDPETVEQILRSTFRLKKDEVYESKLISPAKAEKLKLAPRRWEKLQEHITQSQGKPAVAPVSDKRPAIQQTANLSDFD